MLEDIILIILMSFSLFTITSIIIVSFPSIFKESSSKEKIAVMNSVTILVWSILTIIFFNISNIFSIEKLNLLILINVQILVLLINFIIIYFTNS